MIRKKTSKKILLLDMDDVTVDQSLIWVKRLYEKTGIHFEKDQWTDWQLSNHLPPEIVHMIFEEINKEPGFFRYLPAKAGAIEGIRELNEYYDIVFVSASESYAYQDKYHWIKENLPFLAKPNLVLTHRKDLIMGDLIVDDGPHNIVNSPAKTKIIFDGPWNRHLTGFARVHHWEQLIKLLIPLDNVQYIRSS